jgi:hypothetical protein
MDYPLPPEPAPNEPLRAAWGAALIRWCRANRLMPTPGMLLSRTASGTSYRPQAVPPAASTPAVQSDFTLYDATGNHTADGGLWVGILFGNVTPNGIPLSTGPGDETTNPWPDVFTADDGSVLPNYEFEVTDSGLAWLHIEVDPTVPQVTGITIESGAAFPAYTDTDGYQGLGNWTVATSDDGSTSTLSFLNPGGGFGSQNYLYCGGFHYFWPI